MGNRIIRSIVAVAAAALALAVPAANAQPGLALTNVTPAGSVSVTCAPLLAAGPLLVTVSVHASGLPGTMLAGALLVSARSAACRDVVEWVVELLEVTSAEGGSVQVPQHRKCDIERGVRIATHEPGNGVSRKPRKLVDEQLAKGVSVQEQPIKRAISSQPVVKPIKVTAPNSVFALGAAYSK